MEHHRAGRLAAAEAAYREILARDRRCAGAWHGLGLIAGQVGSPEAAETLIGRAIAIEPTNPEFHYNLALVLEAQRRPEEAAAACRKALELDPHFALAYSTLGNSLYSLNRLDEAIEALRKALEIWPDHPTTLNTLGVCYKGLALPDLTTECYRKVVELAPENSTFRSNLVCALYFDPAYGPGALLEEARQWDRIFAQPYKPSWRPHSNDPNPDRPLRIGYVSPDFYEHVVGRNLLPLLRHHDRERFEIFCYSNFAHRDAVTDEIRAQCAGWREIFRDSDAKAAETIRADGIDILVDLALHSLNNRLLVFARKPAPVQVSYLGLCGTTGLEAIDYRLSDPFLDPPGTDADYSEATIRLPHGTWSYEPSGPMPEASPLPALEKGYLTFICRNAFAKVSPATLDLWVKVLARIPDSRLLLAAPEGSCRERILRRFEEGGVSRERLELAGLREPWERFIASYERADIALDPFPYCGWITTCDALWLGLPVITLTGRTVMGRGGCSTLANLGLSELIANTPEEYVEIARSLAGDLPRLAELRSSLRQRMERSPLRDPAQLARDIETAYREMWRRWCARQSENRI
jgi:predicted O-linked N-acetylglucosamine transferase (SPINDLY family)